MSPPPRPPATPPLQTSPERRALAMAAGPSPDWGTDGKSANGNGKEAGGAVPPPWWSPKNPYRVRTDIPNFLDLR